ncbi:MAG: nitroreductase family protein [Proteobacteria bacterium]|nr:nitroreductase family protein [Pseudomonadota bacterium]MBU1714682.1 nitroreductase family protein [Pseudomonadota bacterium]
MKSKLRVVIDPKRCVGCKLCLDVCPDKTISMAEKVAVVSGEKCIACGHCQAVCPAAAIIVGDIDPESSVFSSFTVDDRWLAPGAFDLAALVRLMASRRSCRNYTERQVERAILGDLVKIAITAPSGTNSQQWTFTILDRRAKVEQLGVRVAACFKKLNRMAVNPFYRIISKVFGADSLGNYYRRYYKTIRDGIKEWENGGRDLLFHGAPAVILVGAAPGASCPMEDAMLASQNILLAAHAMGLGTCLIGFAVAAIKRDPAIKKFLAMPAAETVYAVITLGYPAEVYQRTAGRKKIEPRYPEVF